MTRGVLATKTAKANKPSGVAWLGEIPEGWNVSFLAQVVSQVKKRNDGLREKNLLSLSYGRIKRKPIDTIGGLLPTTFDSYNIIEANDIVLRLTDLQNDQHSLRVGLSHERGIITSAYTTLRPSEGVDARSLFYLLHAFDIRKGFYGMGAGVRQSLKYDEVKVLPIAIPPLPEQRAIADYLDEKCGAIDAAIAEAKKGIEEYKVWKKSLIFEAVTGKRRVGAFNAKTQSRREAEKMKHSGIPWIGAIPEEWRVNKGRFIYDIATGKKDVNAEAPDGQYMFFTCSKTAKRIATYSFDCEALLVAGNGEVGFTQYYKGKFDAYQRTYVISGFRGVAPLFLRYYMSGLLPLQAQYNSVGSVIEFIKLGDLKGFVVTLPSLPEQQVIADYLDEKCAAIDAMVAEKEALIADLEAYKKSLIYETVTGKREVA